MFASRECAFSGAASILKTPNCPIQRRLLPALASPTSAKLPGSGIRLSDSKSPSISVLKQEFQHSVKLSGCRTLNLRLFPFISVLKQELHHSVKLSGSIRRRFQISVHFRPQAGIPPFGKAFRLWPRLQIFVHFRSQAHLGRNSTIG